MLYWLLVPLAKQYHILNVFRYITTRTICATLTALCICFIIGHPLIRWLKSQQKFGQPIRKDGPAGHIINKAGTPTMGGVLMLGAIIGSAFLWCDWNNPYIWITVFVLVSFGALGYADDYIKLKKNDSAGLSGRTKFITQIAVASIISVIIVHYSPEKLQFGLSVPFFKDIILNFGWFFIVFSTFVLVGTSNAVNLTDGLDGLAIVPVMICALCFCVISYLVGHIGFANYLKIAYMPEAGELSVICGAIIGASLGFLWFNAPPAMVFMGDTGSLSLGGGLATIAIITKHELVLVIIGGLFVIEALSVIIQVSYYKLTKKRVFLMAPIHHHFEKKGWAEATIVIRFWIISIVLALVGMATLKLR